MLLFFLCRYLFSIEPNKIVEESVSYLVLTRRDLAGKGSKIISRQLEAMILDYLNKRVIILTERGVLVSLNYDGGNRSEILGDRQIDSGEFYRIASLMYFRKTSSPVIVEMNMISRNISRYLWFTDGKYPNRLIVVDRSLQPGGRFYMNNILLLLLLLYANRTFNVFLRDMILF